MFQGLDLASLHRCILDSWSPGLGDPTVAGWLTVAAYVGCAGLAALVLRRRAAGQAHIFWLLISLAMAFLALNKQLDLQSLLTASGRCVARQQGWYDERQAFQRHFIEGLLIGIALMLALGLYLLRRDLRQNGLALIGLVVVAGFVAIRAVGFHHVDAMLNLRVQNLRYNVIFELSGLTLIALNALWLLRGKGRRP